MTTRCNLQCPICFSRANDVSAAKDPSIEDILNMIPDYRGRSGAPNISLVGGESTLREDLPEIIEAIIEKRGLVPRLNTNGLLLLENDLLRKLKKAGLRWIILQFDGLDPSASMAFRGRDLVAVKNEVIIKASQLGFFFHMAVMVKKGINDHQVVPILQFAAAHPNIRRVSFYPCSDVGRMGENENGETHVFDVMQAIEKGTEGQVRIEDILAGKKMGQNLFRFTQNPMFRARPCMYSFIIFSQKKRLIPCNRFFSPRWAIREIRAFLKFAWHAAKMLRPSEGDFPADFIFVNIEKFYSDNGFDLQGARNCHHIYLTDQGAYPFCCYNTLYRNASDSHGK